MSDYAPEDLIECHRKIAPFVHRTPVMRSRLLDGMTGAELYFKCENFQRAGSYKIRGATHALLRKKERGDLKGIVTHSSGNFAQALSLAAKNLGVPAYIVMPESAPEVKKRGVREYGGQIFECASTLEAREAEAIRIQEETGAEFIHPSNDPWVMMGQGTACKELLEDVSDLEMIVAPVGGGGLLGGTSLSANFFGNNCTPVGAEPLSVDDAYRSLQAGRILGNTTTDTIADGLKTVLGSYTFPVLQAYVKTIIRVSEEEIVQAMRLVWERMKIVIEPSSAVALAAIFRDRERFAGRKTGIVISGGNVDLEKLPF
ncbi:MAG: pyridoxal-phosphate dependent enzyme [Robiginitalea sp.]|jgi:threonine dehydratase